MKECSRMALAALTAAMALAAGCGGSTPPPSTGARPAESAVSAGRAEEARSDDADRPLAERWRAPFAVSSVGRAEPSRRSAVVITGMEPTIASGLVTRGANVEAGPDAAAGPEAAAGAATGVETSRTLDAVTAAQARTGAENAEASSVTIHRVGPGETLWGIARRYNVTPESIQRANRLLGDELRLGQMLVIPD